MTINPADFPNSATITVTVPAGAFTDESGNAFAGIAATEWSFSTEAPADTEVPTITTYAPADESANIAVAENLVLTFSEEVVKGTGNITISQGTTSQIIDVITAAVVVNGNQVTINPPADFPSQTAISVEIAADVFRDVAGNSFAGILTTTTWNFTTEDTTVPTLTTFTPANNSTNAEIDDNLVLTFSENIVAGVGSLTINQGATSQTILVSGPAVSITGNTATINPSDFPNSATINVTVPAGVFADAAGNAFAGITSTEWSFTTEAPADTEAPTVTAYTPADNATNVTLASDLILTFSEEVIKGTGNITITQGAASQTIAVTNAAVVVNGTEVTINPPDDFPSQAQVSVQIGAGAFKDLAGNNYSGIPNTTTWNFTTEDNTTPALTSFTPANNATEVAVDASLVIGFSENIQAGTGSIIIKQGATSQTIPITDPAVSITGNMVTINPLDFPNSATITVTIPVGAFTDEAGNEFAGIASTEWSFTTEALADTEAPIVTTYAPADNANNIPVGEVLVLTFDEAVQKGSGSISIKYGSSTQLIEVSSASVTVSGAQATINPATDLPEGTAIQILIQPGTFTDMAGNAFAGIADETTWNFSTEDTTEPVVSELSPADGASNIARNTHLILTFSEPVQKGTGNITINEEDNIQIIPVNNAAVTISGAVATINPPAELLGGKEVIVDIPVGAFKDVSGNNFNGITNAWSFTVADEDVPVVTAFNPVDGATDVVIDANLTITFSEEIVKGTGNIVINQGATSQTIPVTDAAISLNGNQVTINPPADLPSGAQVSIQISAGAFKDVSGNEYAGITSETAWNFIVKDITAPVVTSRSPADNASTIAVDANLVLEFSETVKVGEGNITINKGTNTQVIPVKNPAFVSVSGKTATINPSDFPNSASVSITIPAGAFTDEAGNEFAGIASSEWSFITEEAADETAPVVTTYTPADEATAVALTSDLVLTFDEEVVKGTGNMVIYQGTTSQTIAVTETEVVVNGNQVTIDPALDFASATPVYVTIQAGAFTDVDGNAFAGITSNTTWNFTTEDNTAPALTSFTPADNSTGVAIDADLVLTFTENVQAGTGNIVINQGTTSQTIAVTDAAVSIADNVVTIDPSDFPNSASVSITVAEGAFTDEAGNEFAGIAASEWRFTTQAPADNQPPTVTSYAPLDNATGVVLSSDLVLTFSETVVKGAGTILLSQGTTTQTIPVSDNAVTVNGNVVTIDPPTDFPSQSAVSVQIAGGAFTDVAGNDYAGITSPDSWNFTSEDKTAPVVTTFSPADNFIGVEANANLVLTFSENMQKGTGTITLHQGLTSQQIAVGSTAVTVNDNIITIDPPTDFPFLATVWVEIPAGAFIDISDNAYEGISAANEWNFTVIALIDTTDPTLTATTPADEASKVGIADNLQLTFSEPVQKGSGTITITQGTTSQLIAVSDGVVAVNGSTVTIDPPIDFPSQTQVSVQIEAGTFEDAAGNEFAGITNTTSWNFTTEDKTAPEILTLTPADDLLQVPVNANLEIVFDENIQKGAGEITINQGTTTQQIAISSANVTVDETKVTIDIPDDMPAGTNVYVLLPQGAFIDLSGNPSAFINEATAWNFRTADPIDDTPPSIVTLSPADNSTNIPIDTELVLTFNEAVKVGTGSITITHSEASQTIPVTDAVVSISGNTVTINPADFPNSATITVTIPAGAFTDESDNAFAGITATEWGFTTQAPVDTEVPTITTYAPADEAANVAIAENLVLTFSEEVVKGTGNITINQGTTSQIIDVITAAVVVNGNQVTINPPADFPSQTAISVEIAANVFRDVAGNSFAGILTPTVWNFTTEDITASTLTAFTPANNATEVAVNESLELTFDEPIQAGTGNITITQGETSQTIAVTDAAVTIADNVVSINPADFPNGTIITVTVPAGAFTDAAGNEFAGIAATDWSFTTEAEEDNTAPVVTAFSPTNGSTSVPAGENLILTFSEQIAAGTGKITITQGTASQEIVVPNGQVTIAGNTVTINPAADLLEGEDIAIQIEAGTFTDLAGNPYAGIINSTTWTFTTEEAQDETAPIVSEYAPADGEVDVPLNTNLVLTFDEPVVKGTGNITITQGADSQTIAVTDAAVSVNGNTVTINPTTDFAEQTLVNVQIQAGAIKDATGNDYTGIVDNTTWNFTTAATPDNTPPILATLVPANDANNIAIDANLIVTFDEPVIAGTGNIIINQGATSQTIAVTDASVTINGNEVTINPADFPNGTIITVTVPAGAFTDAAGNAFAGIAATDWSFTTEASVDTEAPTVITYVPADGATQVAVASNLVLTFSETVVKGEGNIVITQGATTQAIAVTDAAVTVNGTEATINPPDDFPAGTDIYVQIEAGAFKDAAGNNYGGIANNTTWNFTTAATPDITAPVLDAFVPADNANNIAVNANLVLTFSEEVVAGEGNITINQGATSQIIAITDAAVIINGNQVTINPPQDFPNGATISVTIPAAVIKDAAGNEFAGITADSWSFTTSETADTQAPTVTTYVPEDDANDIDIAGNLVLTFNEPVEKGAGNITITQGEATQTIAVTDAAVSVENNQVTINPPADLPEGTPVSVQIEEGAITDVAGNEFAGIADNTTWNFTTATTIDETAPTLTAFTPANNATEVAVNESLELTFDEPIQAGTGNIIINQGETSQTIAVTDAAVTLADNVVTINLADFPNGATITVTIPAGAFTDAAGNEFAGIAATDWSFTTAAEEDITAPAITTLAPADEAINVPEDANLVITFNEAVETGGGNIIISQGETSQTIAVTDAAVTVDGTTVTINPPDDFPAETAISIQMDTGAFKDLAGNNFEGIINTTTWNFTTVAPADIIAPVLSSFTPDHNAANIGTGQNITLTFNEPVVAGAGNITIDQGSTSQTIAVTDASVTINGNEVTINPADFPNGTIITVTVPAGAFTDAAGNEFAGIAATDWSFTIQQAQDETAPVLTETLPVEGAVNVAVNENITLTFNENVKAGGGNITITHGATSQTIPVTDEAFVNITGNIVTINPADFPNSATVTVTIPAGAFQDAAGNNTEAITRTFSVTAPADETVPIISNLSPPDNATDVTVNADLVITFNEEVKKGTGTITINQGGTTQTIDVSDETVNIQGTTVTINPPEDFPAGSAVSIQMPAGVFTDLADNPFAGITAATTWNFTVASPADNIPPLVVSFAPADGAQNVAAGSNLIITFNEPVKKGRGNLIINLGNSTQTLNVASEAVTVQGNTITINPPEDFPSGTNVNILMLSGVFTDLANNSYAGIDNAETWNFSVPDNIPPVRTLLYPPDNSTDVPPNINLIMIFSENIKKGTGNITITREGTTQTQVVDVNSDAVTVSGTTVIINPTVNFPAASTVTIQMPEGIFTDISGNPYSGISDPTEWNLTISGTVDVMPPSIVELQPQDDAVDVAPTSNLVITFSENVQKGTGNITITQGATTQVIPVTSEAVTIEGTTVTIDPPNDLPEGAAVNVQIPSGVFSDVSNNIFAGITNATTWNFTVNTATPSDNIAPEVSVLSPADDALNVPLDADLVITFNEAVKKGSGLIIIQQNNSNRIINVNNNDVSVNGNVVTIKAANFPANRPLYILITEGTFTDIAGNDFAGINDETGWNFTTGAPVDNTAPAVRAYAPADNAQNVPVAANLVLTFNETVKKGTGNITITQGTTTQTINVNSNAVSVAANKVTINPVADFPLSTAISVQMPAGIFTDNAGNNYAGIANATTWNFTTADPADTTPPTVITYNPADGAANVAVAVNLSITFSEPVVKGTGNITVTQGATTQTIAVTSAAVSVNGATVAINPPANLPGGTAISVQIEAGAFKDTAGNNFAGINNTTTWNFTTVQPVDTTPPQGITLSPADNAQDVAPNANLVITFNEPVKAGTGTIVINQGNTSQSIVVPGANITIAGSTVTINPPADFPAGATIGVEIPQGALTDLAGNAYEGLDATQWSFTVAPGADTTPPQISTLSPVNNAPNIAIDVNLSITFNEAIEKGTGNILIRQGNTILQTIAVTNASVTVSGNTLTINPAANLPAGTLLNVQLEDGTVKDLAGNTFAGITNTTTWRFTTIAPADTTPPVLSSLSPVNGAVNVTVNTNLSLTFNETIKKKTGDITLTVNGTAQAIPVTDASVTVSGNTVTINPASDFPFGAQVSVEIPAGVISDVAGNNFGGITAAQWAFTIVPPVDNTAPTVTAFSPADNSIDVEVNTDLVITFSEPIDKGTGTIEIRQEGTLQTIQVTDPSVTISGNTVTINPASDFEYEASVNIQMPSGVFADKAGNPYAGIASAGIWNFETADLPDQVPPAITTFSPADNAQNVKSAENLVITFSEPVKKGTGTISISQNGTVQQISVSDAAVTVAGNVVTINPATDFTYEADVFVEIEAGVFTDNSNNNFAGISGNEVWNFTIELAPDTTAPTIVSVNPADDATNIAPDTELTITFSEPVQKGNGTIILTQGTSSQTIDINSSAISISSAVLTINPETNFPSGASVSVLIIPGAITDLAGNAFAGITDAATWNFTIQDIIAPQLTAIFPEDNATGIAVNTNLVMSFDEEIKKGTGVITISDGITTQTIDVNSDAVIISGTTVIINPPANFGFDATISVQMGSGVLTDLAGNPFAGITDPAAWTITVAGFVDDVPPAVVSLSPEDNAVLVPSNTILEMVFSENVQKGAGAITITQGGISKTMNVSSGAISINGAKVTILPDEDFDLGAEVYILVPKGAFADLSNNPFAGILTATGWNFTIDQTVPVSIVNTSFPEVILSSEATTQASVELNRVPQGLKVEFVFRGIAREQWQKQTVSSSTLTFTASMPQASFDEIGLEYYFDITQASGFKIASDTGYTYIQYVGNGLDVTGLKFGNQVSDYQIISVPLELKNKQVNDVLEDNLGEYNIKKWRLFNYKNELLQEYKDGFTTLEAGEAYWLIVKNEANVNTGEGTTLKVRKANPYTLSLKKGWNQIGNPYNFNISWADVRTYNNNPEGLGNLRPFEEEFLDSDLLMKQRGAFVFVENDMTIQIPVLKNNTANGRISAEQELKFTPNTLWEINFALISKEMPYRLAGLGMHPEASQSKDRYDDITVPRFVKYLEMNFKHPEYFAPDFTRDIRPVEENQQWEFTVESNLEPQAVNLQWHSYFSQGYENGKKLMLLDVNHNRIVDLSRQNQYSFWQDSLTAFRMYYGSPEYIREHLQSFQTSLSENYPNPFKDNTTITFILSKVDPTYQVKLEVYNVSGQNVATLVEGAYVSGAYQINWDGTDNTGKKLPPGMYIYKLETNSESGPATFTRKMVLQ
ncbi:T9SS type A sorting domain-containing protein [Rhodocytophaga rosea]|uniref:T9SS type A sorting domain-containing protein n=1 Tax=Rhodocytophaga rosea TaxID=2704465 RepID=A0A6C0GTT0_9BACT|nr:Ig-like domain-containing protein [Rhodocytophaga rosea]QHT71575.1 T9SS type A sorting domain-containing protein [Rhodocytophaga rosea]